MLPFGPGCHVLIASFPDLSYIFFVAKLGNRTEEVILDLVNSFEPGGKIVDVHYEIPMVEERPRRSRTVRRVRTTITTDVRTESNSSHHNIYQLELLNRNSCIARMISRVPSRVQEVNPLLKESKAKIVTYRNN